VRLAGAVARWGVADLGPGDPVVGTGFEWGEECWGGYSQLARVKADWLVPLPDGLSLKQAMGIGTAGLTAMLAVMALEEHGLSPMDQREVVVTGAAGGLGSIAVALLAQLGFNVVASTGRSDAHPYLRSLGATDIIDRQVLAISSDRPLQSERWAGAVDAVGGDTLATLLQTMARGGSVAACGNAGGFALKTTVFPFILRGVNLLGIDSNLCPMPRRRLAWDRLRQDLPPTALDRMIVTVPLTEVPSLSHRMLAGQIQGRVVVDVKGGA